MPTPFESAQLILTLYEQRREETMRKARDFMFTFAPRTADEMIAGYLGPQSGYVRMVIGYWEMAASLVSNGAIDAKMFCDSTGEFVLVFGRIERFLPQLREMFGNPDFGTHLEKLALSLPNARQRIDGTVERIDKLLEARAASAKA